MSIFKVIENYYNKSLKNTKKDHHCSAVLPWKGLLQCIYLFYVKKRVIAYLIRKSKYFIVYRFNERWLSQHISNVF